MHNDQNGLPAPQSGNLTDVIGSWVAQAVSSPFSTETAVLGTIYAEPMCFERVSFLQLLQALHSGEMLKCDEHVKDELLTRIRVIDPANEWALSSLEKDDEAGIYWLELFAPCKLIEERLAQCFAPSVEEFKNLAAREIEMAPHTHEEVATVC